MTTTTELPIDQKSLAAAYTVGSVEIEGFTVRYFDQGEGEPLVALHGAGGPEFSIALALLAAERRVIQIEIPGFGDTVNEVHQTLAELAEAVAQAIEAIGIERYSLMGTSFGGAVATHLAIAHPDRLVSLVLESPALFREGAGDPTQMSPEESLRAFRANPNREPVPTPPDPEAMGRTWPLVGRLLASLPPVDQSVIDQLATCPVRTLVLFGDRDGVIPPQNGRIFRQALPNVSLIYVYGAAHAIQFDRPEAYAEVVNDFLNRGWQFLIPEASTVINP